MKKYDVVALGELLIDFTDNGISEQGNPVLEANPGGAPCNVLAMLTKLGRKVAFIGKVGNDGFGKQLRNAIVEQGISDEGLKFDDEVHTTLAIVLKTETGDRDFAFYRKPGADVNITADEIDEELIKASKIFHFGTLSLTDEPAVSATHKAIRIAKENGLTITFDPNLREPLWDSLDSAHKQVDWGLQQCDVLKISDNEIQWFTGKEDFDQGIKVLQETYPNIKLITLSLGPDGSRAYYKDIMVEKPAFLQEGPVETTGCGDTFCGNLINTVLEYGLDDLNEEILSNMLVFANAAASLVSKKKGALRVMPTKEEVEAFLATK
ncbi:MAG: carbohydrate kinase [Bacillota bacterium]|nr:carbohydrate kinase [Bacillota bacterium]